MALKKMKILIRPDKSGGKIMWTALTCGCFFFSSGRGLKTGLHETERNEHKRWPCWLVYLIFELTTFQPNSPCSPYQFGGGGAQSTAAAPEPAQPNLTSPTSQGPPPSKKEYDESRIQVQGTLMCRYAPQKTKQVWDMIMNFFYTSIFI